MSQKIYSEPEIHALLGRAARFQAARQAMGRDGLTLEEIKKAAAGAGIDPRFVDMASTVSSDHENAYWGIPVLVGRSVTIRGALTDEQWSRMVAVFSHEFGGAGDTQSKAGSRAWSRDSIRITTQEETGQILLNAEVEWGTDLQLPIVLTLVGAVVAATTGALALVSLEWTIGVVAALVALMVVGSFSSYRKRAAVKQARYRRDFESVLDRCVAIVHEEGPTDVDHTSSDIDAIAGQIALPDADPNLATTVPQLRHRDRA